jgi:hypothetical protein
MPNLPPLTFQWEPLSILLDNDNLDLLVRQHWREIALDHDTVPLDVDWEAYLDQEREGRWRAFVGRRAEKLVSYIPAHFHRPARYRSTLYIQEDTIWVVPDEPDRGLVWWRTVSAFKAAVPRPCKLQIKSRLRDGKTTTPSRILERLGLPAVEVLHSAYLE